MATSSWKSFPAETILSPNSTRHSKDEGSSCGHSHSTKEWEPGTPRPGGVEALRVDRPGTPSLRLLRVSSPPPAPRNQNRESLLDMLQVDITESTNV